MKRAIVLAGLLLLFCAGVYGVWAAAQVPDWTGRASVTIALTEKGFSPPVVYISRGTTVTFTTARGTEFWPASDLHPFHSILPGFDPKRPLKAQESWSFTFTKDGRWSYHDHIAPLMTGAIIVVPPGERGDKKYDLVGECDQEDGSALRSCQKLRIQFTLEKKGLDAAFDEIQSFHSTSTLFVNDCHLYAHDLGLLAYKRYGDHIPLTEKMAGCGQGFFHGYMEGYLMRHNGDVRDAERFCERVGRAFSGTGPIIGAQCYHGIGHGVMEFYLSTRLDLMNDLPELVGMGLRACSAFATEDHKFRCASGAYAVTKDWINLQSLHAQYPDYFSLRDPFALCREAGEPWTQEACAWEFAKEVLVLASFDADRAFPVIIERGNEWAPQYVKSMILSAAFLIGEWGVNSHNGVLVAACRTVPQDLRPSCIEGIESGLLFNGKPGGEVERSARFCAYPTLSVAEKDACTRRLVSYMADAYGAPGRREACAAAAQIQSTPASCVAEAILKK